MVSDEESSAINAARATTNFKALVKMGEYNKRFSLRTSGGGKLRPNLQQYTQKVSGGYGIKLRKHNSQFMRLHPKQHPLPAT